MVVWDQAESLNNCISFTVVHINVECAGNHSTQPIVKSRPFRPPVCEGASVRFAKRPQFDPKREHVIRLLAFR